MAKSTRLGWVTKKDDVMALENPRDKLIMKDRAVAGSTTETVEISWFGNYALFEIGEGEDAKSIKVWHMLLLVFLIGLLIMLFSKKKKKKKRRR